MSCQPLRASSPEYKAVEKMYLDSWNPGSWGPEFASLEAAPISKIIKVDIDRPDYRAKQEEMKCRPVENGGGQGNEHRRFHGTKSVCGTSFSGRPCQHRKCNMCGILRAGGKFDRSFIRSTSGTATFGEAFCFTSKSHTAKGYGGLRRGAAFDGFERADNGNVLLVCDLLLGKQEKHERQKNSTPQEDPLGKQPLQDGYDSRHIHKLGSNNDEELIFDASQICLKYIIIFGAEVDANVFEDEWQFRAHQKSVTGPAVEADVIMDLMTTRRVRDPNACVIA